MKKYYMAIDQYGQTEHSLTHPRRDLMQRYATKHADKIYRDTVNSGTFHVGYSVRGHWFIVYEVTEMRRPA